jgi:hypothetical protein
MKIATLPALVALLLVTFIAFGVREGAYADDVPTGATIGGAGALPIIECAWVLPDVSTTATNPQTMQYGNDDNVAQPSPTPCTSDGFAPATQASVPGAPLPGQIHVHINPNPEDKPNTQLIELWGAIDPPSGTASAWTGGAFWKVYHPNGTLKVQVESTKVTPQGSGGCGQSTGLEASLASMLAAAGPGPANTGQLSSNAINSIVGLCQQNGKALYHGTFELHKYQPCGDYKVEFYATGGATNVVLTYWFNVPCIFQLQIDFDGVQWGTIIPGQTGQVLGDTNFVSPACTATPAAPCPTVKNVGNSGMGLSVLFTDMVQCSDSATQSCPDPDGPIPGPKKIVDFDGCFGRSPSTIQCIDPAPAGACTSLSGGDLDPNCNNKSFTFDTNRERTLCANEVGKLDLSIHPVLGLPAGVYQGQLFVTGIAQTAQQYCGELGAPGGGNLPGGS